MWCYLTPQGHLHKWPQAEWNVLFVVKEKWILDLRELYSNYFCCAPVSLLLHTMNASLSSYFRLMIWLDCKHFVRQNSHPLYLHSFKTRNMCKRTQISFCISYFIRVIMCEFWFAYSTKWLQTVFDT